MSETEVSTEVQFENSDDLDAFEAGFFGQKPPEPAKETNAEAEQDAEPQSEVETQAQDSDDAQDEAELQEEIPEKPKRKTVQDRIDEVVRQREELRRESQSQIETLRQELEALKKGSQPATEAPKADEPTPDAVDKDGNPVYALGEFDPQYIRDLTRHTLSQERERMQAEMVETQRRTAVEQEQNTLRSSWNGKVEQATQEYPDFQEKGRAMLANFDKLDPNYAGYLTQVLMSMDKGTDVLYYLSNHPEEATAIVNSGAQKATLALGRIESRFLQSEQEAPKPKISKAPTPPPRNTQARGTNGAFISVAPDTDDLAAFEKEFFKAR